MIFYTLVKETSSHHNKQYTTSQYLVVYLCVDTFIEIKCKCIYAPLLCTHTKLLNVFKESFDILREKRSCFGGSGMISPLAIHNYHTDLCKPTSIKLKENQING